MSKKCYYSYKYVLQSLYYSISILGKDLNSGFQTLTKQYGKIVGFWLGSDRVVVISDFEILQDILNKYETADRQKFKAACKYTFQKGCKVT